MEASKCKKREPKIGWTPGANWSRKRSIQSIIMRLISSFGIIDMQAPHRRLPAHRQSGAGELTDDRDALEILMITPLSLEIGPLEGCGR